MSWYRHLNARLIPQYIGAYPEHQNRFILSTYRHPFNFKYFCLEFIMAKMRFITSLIALGALAYGILEVQSYLDKNFVENDTPIKHALNRFLNGENVLD